MKINNYKIRNFNEKEYYIILIICHENGVHFINKGLIKKLSQKDHILDMNFIISENTVYQGKGFSSYSTYYNSYEKEISSIDFISLYNKDYLNLSLDTILDKINYINNYIVLHNINHFTKNGSMNLKDLNFYKNIDKDINIFFDILLSDIHHSFYDLEIKYKDDFLKSIFKYIYFYNKKKFKDIFNLNRLFLSKKQDKINLLIDQVCCSLISFKENKYQKTFSEIERNRKKTYKDFLNNFFNIEIFKIKKYYPITI